MTLWVFKPKRIKEKIQKLVFHWPGNRYFSMSVPAQTPWAWSEASLSHSTSHFRKSFRPTWRIFLFFIWHQSLHSRVRVACVLDFSFLLEHFCFKVEASWHHCTCAKIMLIENEWSNIFPNFTFRSKKCKRLSHRKPLTSWNHPRTWDRRWTVNLVTSEVARRAAQRYRSRLRQFQKTKKPKYKFLMGP